MSRVGFALVLATLTACSVDELPNSDSTSVGSCTILYVSPNGDDTSSGCASDKPKRTIGSALAGARSSQNVAEIRACTGTYDEVVSLDLPVSLRGGWDCSGWKRTATYGFPTFDGTNETIIGGSAVPHALHLTGASVGAASLIDGLTVQGAIANSSSDGVALRIALGATPVVENCRILGGSSTSLDGDGSVGLRVETDASPEVRSCYIDGGTGVTSADEGVGRAGVVVDGAGPWLHDNQITGGAAAAGPSFGVPSVGVVLRDTKPLTVASGKPLRANTMEGGDGNGEKAGGFASVGLLVIGDTDLDVVGCGARAGDAVGVSRQQLGLHSLSTGALRITGSRIYGGDQTGNPKTGFHYGAWIDGAKSLLVENNMIHGGNSIWGFTNTSPAIGLGLNDVGNAIIRFNTIYSGPSGYPALGSGLNINSAIQGGAIVQNNIIAADAGWNEPVFSQRCASTGIFQRFENNLVFNTGGDPTGLGRVFGYGAVPEDVCQEWAYATSIDQMTSHLTTTCSATTAGECQAFGGAKVSGNLTLRANCDGDSGCIQWPACDITSNTCLGSVLDWSSTDNGLSKLFGSGWALTSGIPCAVAKSSLDLEVAEDLFGAIRTKPASMGAHEFDGTCF